MSWAIPTTVGGLIVLVVVIKMLRPRRPGYRLQVMIDLSRDAKEPRPSTGEVESRGSIPEE